MQREIKFRVWDKENKRFAHSDHYLLKATGELQEFLKDNSCNDPECCDGPGQDHMFEVDKDRFVVMQFTGLKDKNGKEIYEGDIVEYKDLVGGNELIETVEWDDSYAGFDPFCDHGVDYSYKINGSDVEIIGNIHEHPDLLK